VLDSECDWLGMNKKDSTSKSTSTINLISLVFILNASSVRIQLLILMLKSATRYCAHDVEMLLSSTSNTTNCTAHESHTVQRALIVHVHEIASSTIEFFLFWPTNSIDHRLRVASSLFPNGHGSNSSVRVLGRNGRMLLTRSQLQENLASHRGLPPRGGRGVFERFSTKKPNTASKHAKSTTLKILPKKGGRCYWLKKAP